MLKGFWTTVMATIREADVILEVLDARMPDQTRNKTIEKAAKSMGKKLILVLNKSDILSQSAVDSIKRRYSDENYVLVSAKRSYGLGTLIRLIKTKSKKDKLKVAFVGYPNTGKSSLINRFSKRGRSKISPESGLTRGVQFISAKGGVMLMDTPGVVPYEGRQELLLGLTSAVSPLKLKDPDLVALEILKILKENNPAVLEDVYGLNSALEVDDLLLEFGKKRQMLMKGGVIDERRASIQILNDWHNGKIKV